MTLLDRLVYNDESSCLGMQYRKLQLPVSRNWSLGTSVNIVQFLEVTRILNGCGIFSGGGFDTEKRTLGNAARIA